MRYPNWKYVRIAVGVCIVLYVSLLGATSAYATEPVEFEAVEEYPQTLATSVSSVTVLEDGEDSISCGKVEYKGTLEESSPKLVFTPTYKECTGDIEGTKGSATITPGSCRIELSSFHEGPEVEGEVRELTGDITIGPSGCGAIKIEVPAASCTFEVAPQGPDASAKITPGSSEEEVPMEISAGMSAATVSYTSGCAKAPCPKMPVKGNADVSGFGNQIGAVVAGRLEKGLASFEKATLTFYVKNVEVKGKVVINKNEVIEIRNTTPFLIEIMRRNIAGNPKWKYVNIAKTRGEACSANTLIPLAGVFYWPAGAKQSCTFELQPPVGEVGTKTTYQVKGRVFDRGEAEFEN